MKTGELNPFNDKPFSQKYFEILKERRNLPVFEYIEEFYKMVSDYLRALIPVVLHSDSILPITSPPTFVTRSGSTCAKM